MEIENRIVQNNELFQSAIVMNRMHGLENLLRKEGRNIDIDQVIIDDCTGLHLAIKNGNVKMIKLLLRYSANVKAKNKDGNSCLHLASEASDTDIVLTLLKEGVKVNELNRFKSTPLHLAVSQGRYNSALLLLNNKAKVNIQNNLGETPLFEAIKHNDLGLINCLLEHGADPNLTNNEGDSAFHKSFLLCNEDITNLFLSCNASVALKNWNGENALHLAARYSTAKIIKKIIEFNVNCNEKTLERNTPLHLVLKYNENSQKMIFTMVKLLVSHGCEVNSVDDKKRAPFFYSVENKDLVTAKYLLESGAQIDSNGNNQSIFTALKNEDIKMIKFLITQGAKVNIKDEDDTSPLHTAIQFIDDQTSRLEIVKLLLAKGANINDRDRNKATALQMALDRRDLSLIKFLIKQGSSINTKNKFLESPLYTAVENGLFDVAINLIELGACVNDCTSNKISILCLAIVKENPKIVNILLANGADPNDASALMEAAEQGNLKTMKSLVSNGAIIDPKKSLTAHPIFLKAVQYNRTNMVQYLLFNGADINKEFNNSVALGLVVKNFISRNGRNTIKILVRHIALLLSLNKPVNDINLNMIKSKQWIFDYFNVCKQEIITMKKTKIYADSNLTFFNILTKQRNALANCLRDKYVNVRVINGFHKILFPKYSYNLEGNFLYGVQRLKLIDEFERMLSEISGDLLPHDVISQVSEYFNNEDMATCLR